MIDTPEIVLRVDGKPMGWQRTRVSFKQRRHFNDPKTERGEANVVIAWLDAGSPRMPDDAALDVTVEAVLARPDAHWRKDGSLSAAGLRMPYPTKKPDDDNLCKLVRDALNTRAYRDDKFICHGVQIKRWANPGEHEHTLVHVRPLPVPYSPLRLVGDDEHGDPPEERTA